MADEKLTKSAEIGEVPAHWDVVQLSHFTSRITYGFTNPMPTTDEGPFMLTARDVNGGRIDYDNARRTSWDAYQNELTDKSRPRVGDVLLTRDGSIGRVALCERPDVCAINQSVALLQPNERIEPRFLKFLLEVPHYQQRMEGDADGTTIKHIYITRVDKMQVAVPPLAEQRAIAAILGALDDKIELNRRMNATLEAMARALFQSWFVDFDPVRAKLDGRQPLGLDEATAALFPDSFDETELGHMPRRVDRNEPRRVDRLPQRIFIQSEDWQESGVPVVKIGSVGIIDLTQVSYVSEEIAQWASRYRLSTGDMLIGMTGYVGEVGLVPPSDNPPLLNQRVGKFVMAKPGNGILGVLVLHDPGA